MKKLLTIFAIFFLLCIGANAEENIDGYQKAEFEKFNSYASDNGLEDTPIYVEGVVHSKVESNSLLAFILEQDDGNEWLVFVWDNPDEARQIVDNLIEERVRVFGNYSGFSDVFHMPAISVMHENNRIEKYEAENGYIEIYSFSDWLSEYLQNPENAKKRGITTNESENKAQNKEEKNVQIEESCIYDGNGVLVYATGIKEESGNYEIGIYIENNSSLNLGFNAHAYGVNGVMTGNNIYDMDCDVAAGKKANAILEIEKDFLKKYNIQEIRNIDVLFWAYDNDKNFKEFDTGQLVIKTNLYDESKTDQISGETIYDKDGIRIDRISENGNSFTYSLLNTTGQYFDFDVDNVTINGFTSSDIDFDLVSIITMNGCQSIFTIEPRDEFKETSGIDTIESIEFILIVRPCESHYDEWSTELISG